MPILNRGFYMFQLVNWLTGILVIHVRLSYFARLVIYRSMSAPKWSLQVKIGRPEKSKVDQIIGAIKIKCHCSMVTYASP